MLVAAGVARRPQQRALIGGHGIGPVAAPGARDAALGAGRHVELQDPGIGWIGQARTRVVEQEGRQIPRSEEARVGKEGFSTGKYRWVPVQQKKNKEKDKK